MSGYVIEIPQEQENSSIWSRQLRVAAYCRVSASYEEQQQSLENQIEYFTQYIKRNPFWRFVAHEESARIPKDAERLPKR